MDTLQTIAPRELAYSWDKVGLQVGDPGRSLSRAVISLDRSLGAVEFAKASGAELLLSHHPLIFSPLSTVDSSTYVGSTVLALAKADIAFVAAHTNWDCARGGVNDTLCEALGIRNVTPFGSGSEVAEVKLCVFAPGSAVDSVLDAAAAAGAGVIGAYRRCAFTSSGQGTFEPQEGANPTIGKVGARESVEELRIEMVLPVQRRSAVEAAVRAVHLYEEPALDFLALQPRQALALGRIGEIEPTTLREFGDHVDAALNTRCWIWGETDRKVTRVAVVGGGADDEWRAAQAAGADVFVTGEVKQHVALECVESGAAIIAAGHYATEQPGCAALRSRLAATMPDVDWLLFEPKAGTSGRPL